MHPGPHASRFKLLSRECVPATNVGGAKPHGGPQDAVRADRVETQWVQNEENSNDAPHTVLP